MKNYLFFVKVTPCFPKYNLLIHFGRFSKHFWVGHFILKTFQVHSTSPCKKSNTNNNTSCLIRISFNCLIHYKRLEIYCQPSTQPYSYLYTHIHIWFYKYRSKKLLCTKTYIRSPAISVAVNRNFKNTKHILNVKFIPPLNTQKNNLPKQKGTCVSQAWENCSIKY